MKKYIALFLILLLTSCGFHLRGDLEDGNAGNFSSLVGTKFYFSQRGSLGARLERTLVAYKAKRVKNKGDADYVINIVTADKKSILTSIVGGASNNTYQLIYSIEYYVTKTECEKIISHKCGESTNSNNKESTNSNNKKCKKVTTYECGKTTTVIPDSTVNAQQFWQSNSATILAQNNQSLRIYNYLEEGLVNRIVLQIAELLPSKESPKNLNRLQSNTRANSKGE